jgi:histidinol-phosphate/aromatic aminotransferase/cobyric acid decarboxylase-like protein
VVLRAARRRRVPARLRRCPAALRPRDGKLFDGLGVIPGARPYPSAANFALIELDRPAAEVANELLVRHGVYVRDCGDNWRLEGGRFLRVAARREQENDRVRDALADVLAGAPSEIVPAAEASPDERGAAHIRLEPAGVAVT